MKKKLSFLSFHLLITRFSENDTWARVDLTNRKWFRGLYSNREVCTLIEWSVLLSRGLYSYREVCTLIEGSALLSSGLYSCRVVCALIEGLYSYRVVCTLVEWSVFLSSGLYSYHDSSSQRSKCDGLTRRGGGSTIFRFSCYAS